MPGGGTTTGRAGRDRVDPFLALVHALHARDVRYDEAALQKLIAEKVTFETFFKRATLHPNVHLITGTICGYRVEEIPFPLTRQACYLDKLVDELAKGRPMEKTLRTESSRR